MKKRLSLLVLVSLLMTNCGSNLYDLPPPPPKEEWKVYNNKQDDSQEDAQRFLAAKRAIFQLAEALQKNDHDAVWSLLSFETQNFLDYVSANQGGLEVLKQGVLTLLDGEIFEINPVSLLLLKDIDQIEDNHGSAKQAETTNRKELFLINELGRVKKVIMIREAGSWKLHKTRFDPDADRDR